MAGPLLIAFASILWATDALVRFPAAGRLDPTFIVFVEHLLGTAALLPCVWLKRRRGLFALGWRAWIAAFIVGAGGSALATVFFTASFLYLNPTVTILLQKLQPVLVVAIASATLGEKPSRSFLGWAGVALAAAVVLSVPDFNFHFGAARRYGLSYAAASVALWAVSTVAGKYLLRRASADVATFWRFAIGLGTLAAMLGLAGRAVPLFSLDGRNWLALSYLSLFPGVLAMFVYYAGLGRTSASVTTFVELIFPVAAVAINWVWLGEALNAVQLGAGAVLLFAVTMISRS